MAIDVVFDTSRKGSNPGGKVRVRDSAGRRFEGYLKYCTTPSSLRGSFFGAPNQPFYEAATFELARWFGLHTPSCYVVLNKGRNVNFEGWKEVGEIDPSGRAHFFVSTWIDSPLDRRKESYEDAKTIVEAESPYLYALHVSDVVGRRQNYLLCEDQKSARFVSYVDLGCSFVHASGGRLLLPTKNRFRNHKDLKLAETKLAKYAIISADGDRFVDLGLLPGFIRELRVATLNPLGRVPLSKFLSQGEMEEIEKDVVYNVFRHLSHFEKKNVLIEK